jgi:hypothetical protein
VSLKTAHRHDITEILLKVALNTITLTPLKTAHIFHMRNKALHTFFGINHSTILIFYFGIIQTVWYFHFIIKSMRKEYYCSVVVSIIEYDRQTTIHKQPTNHQSCLVLL